MVTNAGLQRGGVDRRLQDLGIELPAPPTPLGSYVETVQTGDLLFLSGILPVLNRKPTVTGVIGKDVDVDGGRKAAYTAALNVLSVAKERLGSLDRIGRVVRLGVFLTTSEGFVDHPKVADAASDLLRDIFGEDKLPVRIVVGVATLPLGVPLVLDVVFEVTK